MAQVMYDKSGQPQSVVLDYQEFVDMSRRADRFEELDAKLDGIVQAVKGTYGQAAASRDRGESSAAGSKASTGVLISSNCQAGATTIHTFLGAKGFYVGDKRFCVLKGSYANERTSPSFAEQEHLDRLRKMLLRDGILVDDQNARKMVFTRDWEFDSSSAAACVVAGSPRSGPASWGRVSAVNQLSGASRRHSIVQAATEGGDIKI